MYFWDRTVAAKKGTRGNVLFKNAIGPEQEIPFVLRTTCVGCFVKSAIGPVGEVLLADGAGW